jgi:hypothetical protein
MWAWQHFPIAWSQGEWQDYKDQWTGPDGYIASLGQGVAEATGDKRFDDMMTNIEAGATPEKFIKDIDDNEEEFIPQIYARVIPGTKSFLITKVLDVNLGLKVGDKVSYIALTSGKFKDIPKRLSYAKGVAEALDKEGDYHVSVQKGKFLPSDRGGGSDENLNYLHDLMNISGTGGGPMLVTISDPRIATEVAAMYGGKVLKTRYGTYRIVQSKGQNQKTPTPEPELVGMREDGVAEGSSSLDEYKRRLASIQSLRYDDPPEYAKKYSEILRLFPEEHAAHANQVQKGSYSPGERGSGTGRIGRVSEDEEMTQKKKEQVVTVKHKDSGKELRIVKTAVPDYQKRGYYPVKEQGVAEGVTESSDADQFENWKAAVRKQYPNEAGQIKFKGKGFGDSIVAEIPGRDQAFGEFNMDTGEAWIAPLDESQTMVREAQDELEAMLRIIRK